MIKSKSIFLILLLACAFMSCQKAEETFNPTPNTNSVTAKVDGEDFAVSGITVSGTYSINSDGWETLGIASGRTRSDGETDGISLTMISTDSTGIQVGDTYVATSLEIRGGCQYFLTDVNGETLEASSLETDVASITITEIDFATKVVSGTFTFEGADDDFPNVLVKVTEGEFKNVSFD